MNEDLAEEIRQLNISIEGLEAQRGNLGDDVVAPALKSLYEKKASLEAAAGEGSSPGPSDERRLVTILFGDLVGSTGFANELDPDIWRQVIATLHTMAGEVVDSHGGQVLQYLGDGFLALFGLELVSEFDPENAIRCGLEIQERVATDLVLPAQGDQAIRLRIGIHTGLVVVGELGSEAHKELTATGDAMNLAARLEAAAPPGGILISAETYRQVRGVFDLTPQPPLELKGQKVPVRSFLVRRARPRPFRVVSRGVMGVESRLIGRDSELAHLRLTAQKVFDGKESIWVQMIGQAGVGKSRLIEEVREWLDLSPVQFWLFKARAFHGDDYSPFSLIRRLWFDRFQIAEDLTLERAERKWVAQFQELSGTDEAEPAHALGLLVGLPFQDSPHIGAMREDPAQIKGRAQVVSQALFSRLRAVNPVVVLLEDLHFADLSSLEYLQDLFSNNGKTDQGIFVLATARPGWMNPIEIGDVLEISPLNEEDSLTLVFELLRNVQNVPQDVLEMIVERSEGIPYYAEEMTNWFLDQGIIDKSQDPWQFIPERLKNTPLPTTLQHLLLTRLSTLPEAERTTLQRGSVFGKIFWTGGD